ARPTSILARVRADDRERPLLPRFPVDLNRVLPRPVPKDLAHADTEVGPEPAAAARPRVETRGDVRVEPDATQINEEAAPRVPDVDHALPLPQRDVERAGRFPGNPELPGEPVTGARRNDGEGGPGTRNGARALVHGPVAGPGADQLSARGHRGAGQLERVAGALGEPNRSLDAPRGQHTLREGNPTASRAAPAGSSCRVDDDGDRGRQMRSKPRISSQS